VGASLGLAVAVFQCGWPADVLGVPHSGPVVSFLPIILISVLFGLAMDYEVFLESGMREEQTHTGRAGQSLIDGAGHSVRGVTATAGLPYRCGDTPLATHLPTAPRPRLGLSTWSSDKV
jgi:RND superfamily putative drug exporter